MGSDIWANQVDAVVIPATACGSSALLSLSQLGVQIIAVRENLTQMQVPPEPLGIKATQVNSYLEAVAYWLPTKQVLIQLPLLHLSHLCIAYLQQKILNKPRFFLFNPLPYCG